ncbi:MAG: 5'-nucleotidase C-terminal domain-containing protein [Bacteroides sp.]|nr:5'-nucleotidase C-terminal domain-containing protein [Roseburia sp.]MCM1346896.1 5'-nucleotidase C-terminal domain-containing protein [Bacteroides sp.]MCM1420625.1 5'-nucleotidase C-terminal domain-containing protein [Bacteroides sp.]
MKRYFFAVSLLLTVMAGAEAQTRYTVGSVKGERIEVTKSLDNCPDEGAMNIIEPYKAAVDSVMCPVLGKSSMFMDAERPESLLSNWVADVLRESSKRVEGMKHMADIGLCNIGGLRAALPEGDVTVGDVIEVAPFENSLCVLTLQGDALLALMRQIAAAGGEGVSHGVELVADVHGALISVRLHGKAIKSRKKYTIATLNYLAEGNDGMLALKDAVECKSTDIMIRDVLMDFIKEQEEQGKMLGARLENRIVVKGGAE